jgi:hypothetical protein
MEQLAGSILEAIAGYVGIRKMIAEIQGPVSERWGADPLTVQEQIRTAGHGV